MYTLSLSYVPQYCQYDAHYCGSASAQMIMNGYPDASTRQLIHQPTIFSWIANNQTESTPYKAPGMVRDAIHHFNAPPSPRSFVARAYADDKHAMYKVMYWMAKTKYPAALMINGNHWVVVSEYTSDVDPLNNSNVQLSNITIHDPLPFCG
jgi:hypothetical protein